ncbi:hypothetical protein L0F63_004103, partial [Massospora cicadina]
MDENICSIPSVVDSLKTSQRKVVYGCFLPPDAEVKVATLTSSITEKVNFVGANNSNLFASLGQFGSHTQGGKDAGAARYISTHINCIATNPSGVQRMRMPGAKGDAVAKGHQSSYWLARHTSGAWGQFCDNWLLNSNMLEDYEKHYYELGVRYIIQMSEASIEKLEKEDLYAKFKMMDSFSQSVVFDEAALIKATKLEVKMESSSINTKYDDGATNSGFIYLLLMRMICMTHELAEKLFRAWDTKIEEIGVLNAKNSLDLWNTNLNLFLKLWEDT